MMKYKFKTKYTIIKPSMNKNIEYNLFDIKNLLIKIMKKPATYGQDGRRINTASKDLTSFFHLNI